jgi:hypothetical protein
MSPCQPAPELDQPQRGIGHALGDDRERRFGERSNILIRERHALKTKCAPEILRLGGFHELFDL